MCRLNIRRFLAEPHPLHSWLMPPCKPRAFSLAAYKNIAAVPWCRFDRLPQRRAQSHRLRTDLVAIARLAKGAGNRIRLGHVLPPILLNRLPGYDYHVLVIDRASMMVDPLLLPVPIVKNSGRLTPISDFCILLGSFSILDAD